MNQFDYNSYYLQSEGYPYDDVNYNQYEYPPNLYDEYYQYHPQMLYPPPIPPMKDDTNKKHKNHNSKQHNSIEKEYYYSDLESFSNQPVCIAIGDIESNVHKLFWIINFIKKTDINFVFIGDIFDDISDDCPNRKQGLKCLKMLYDFLLPFEYESIHSFLNIRFDEKNFNEIPSRVKFVAGNSECDVLKDIVETKEIKKTADGKFVFGKGKYQKTFSEKQLSILYRYFKNCFGVITLNQKQITKNKHRYSDSVSSVFFRHSPEQFNHSQRLISQIPQQKAYTTKSGLCLLIVGHVHYFGPLPSGDTNCQIISIDTSFYQKNKNSSGKDHRVALVSYNPITGFFVEPYFY